MSIRIWNPGSLIKESLWDMEKTGAHIICGVPRTGTSATMGCTRAQYGEELILGGDTRNPPKEELPDEMFDEKNEHLREIANYTYRAVDLPDMKTRYEKTMEMNPTGFWETGFTVMGMTWVRGLKDWFDKLEKGEHWITKIVGSGIVESDPRYIGKIVYTLRDPRSAAKSHQKLSRGPQVDGQALSDHARMAGMFVNTPLDFMKHSAWAAQFFKEHPNIPVLLTKYDDLVENPKPTLDRIFQFLTPGVEAKKEAVDIIQPKLRRSKPLPDTEEDEWIEADKMYEAMCIGDWQKVLDIYEAYLPTLNRKQQKWFCHRIGRPVVRSECVECKRNPKVPERLKALSDHMNINWQVMPCSYECGFDEDNKPLSVMESIANNHWDNAEKLT